MFRVTLVEEIRDGEKYVAAHLKDRSIIPCLFSSTGYVYFKYRNKIYRPYVLLEGDSENGTFLRAVNPGNSSEKIGIRHQNGTVSWWQQEEGGVINTFDAIPDIDFNKSFFPLARLLKLSQEPAGFVLPEAPLLSAPTASDNTHWSRFIATIKTHPFRTLIGVALVAVFLSALLINTLFLPPFLQPLAYLLQNFAASLGTGGIIPLAIGGSLALLTAPKWVGNILQFIGDKIIGGLINRLLFIGYGIVIIFAGPKIFDLIYLTKSTKNPPLNIIDFNFKPDVTLGYLFWIPLTLIRIPIYLTHWIGKGLDRLGMLIAGEFKLTESDNAAVENRQSIDESVAGEDTLSILERIEQSIASLPDRIDDMITSQVSFPPNSYATLKVDPAIFGPKERELIASTYVGFMDWLKSSPITSTSLEEQLERREAFVPPAPSPR